MRWWASCSDRGSERAQREQVTSTGARSNSLACNCSRRIRPIFVLLTQCPAGGMKAIAEQRYSKPARTNLLTLIVMGFSAIGVLRAVLGQQEIRCACLGTVFQLPMSTVTIIEDLGMAAMAGLMLIKAH